jgi:hypothetical protein
MVLTKAAKPAPAATGNGLQIDQLGGSINSANSRSQSTTQVPRPKSRSSYPIVSLDTDDSDMFFVRIAFGRGEVIEYGVGSDWTAAHQQFRTIADRFRQVPVRR